MYLGKFVVLLPLIVAFGVVALKASKAYKATPLQKGIIRECWKSVAYLFAAGIAAWWLLPPVGKAGGTFGFFLASLLAISVILCAVELPPFLDRLHELSWREWRKTPLYSKTGNPVEYIRWARRGFVGLFILFVLAIAGVTALLGGPSASVIAGPGSVTVTASPTMPVPAETSATPSSAPATAAAPSATDTPANSPSASDSSPAQQYVSNSCTGPQQIPVLASPDKNVPFGTGSLLVCYSGKWQHWSDFASTDAPKAVNITAEIKSGECAPDGGAPLACLYARVVDPSTGDSYVIETTDF